MNVRSHRCSVVDRASDFSANNVLRKSRRNRCGNSKRIESPCGVGIPFQNPCATSFMCNRKRALSSAHSLSAFFFKSSRCQSKPRFLGVLAQVFFSDVQNQGATAFPFSAKAVQPGAKGQTNQNLHPGIVTKLNESKSLKSLFVNN